MIRNDQAKKMRRNPFRHCRRWTVGGFFLRSRHFLLRRIFTKGGSEQFIQLFIILRHFFSVGSKDHPEEFFSCSRHSRNDLTKFARPQKWMTRKSSWLDSPLTRNPCPTVNFLRGFISNLFSLRSDKVPNCSLASHRIWIFSPTQI